MTNFWAKTYDDVEPGISVRDHCMNVGCVAEALLNKMPEHLRALLPRGSATLAALHDIGKISAGFQAKCDRHLQNTDSVATAEAEGWKDPIRTERDHAKLSQWYLQNVMRAVGKWSFAVGAHHGTLYGLLGILQVRGDMPATRSWEKEGRDALLAELVARFGPLPDRRPQPDDEDLWLLAGLISVSDWLGSNEKFFPADRGLGDAASAQRAGETLDLLHWNGGSMRTATFTELFGNVSPRPLQEAIHELAHHPGLFIVEGPMGCGKTEAALWAAHRLQTAGQNTGIYFALPTQVTSNRIHERVGRFLECALEEAAPFRLAHGASWLSEKQTVLLSPAEGQNEEAGEHVREGRSWFASAKHALLARYGVGTVDQALQGVVAVKHFFVRRFGLAGKVVILDEVHSYDVYTGTLITHLIRELLALRCTVIVLSATLTKARRAELVAAAGGDADAVRSDGYPLLTVARTGETLIEHQMEPPQAQQVALRYCHLEPHAVLQECLRRAELGQHVLYLRNTVAEAQEAFRMAQSLAREGWVQTGLLHSRFPFFRREELEAEWLKRLGVQRAQDDMGSLLIATQVVEQSVDIDLDFIVTDLAPTDMLLQRMGRLWRHPRAHRCGAVQEFWIKAPDIPSETSVAEIKTALGKSGKVYDPYVLLRSARVFSAREEIVLPNQIREVLEATYGTESEESEPAAWQELREDLQRDLQEQKALADSATRVLGQQSRKDADGLLTRREGAPTRDVVLLSAINRVEAHQWRLTGLNGETVIASEFHWRFDVARLLSRNLVRAPRYHVPRQETPPWLKLHTQAPTSYALIEISGECTFPDAGEKSGLAYCRNLGLYQQPDSAPLYRETNDHDFDYDDEFDS